MPGPADTGLTYLQQLAQFFRMGQFGSGPAPGTDPAGRQRLETAEEIVAAAQAARIGPQSGAAPAYEYARIFIYKFPGTNQVAARIRVSWDFPAGASYDTIYSKLRRLAQSKLESSPTWSNLRGERLDVSSKALGVVEIPPVT